MRRVVLALLVVGCASAPPLRKFPDRPVAWHEHDTAQRVEGMPTKYVWEKMRSTHGILETFVRRADRALGMKLPVPAEDVNALDEVPCSTWFCPATTCAQ